MANPKRRHSTSRQNKRRANWKITAENSELCPQCKSPKLPHRVCPKCGFYNNVSVVKIKEKKQEEKKEGN
ncbi:MAG: 50S ribosomal protein L32 [Elusimicrobia bacterium CG06_land_8_20_14_3_00_38_11]|nr:MAG: 50S ribosomal protein L32 [Elusimicrobia bacterium CG06_land_8_20_14_3_00_38_11]